MTALQTLVGKWSQLARREKILVVMVAALVFGLLVDGVVLLLLH